MFKECLLLMLLGHVFADFYVQTSKIAEKKKSRLRWVFFHCFLYFAAVVFVSLPLMSYEVFKMDIAVALLHTIIDIIKFCYIKNTNEESPYIFIFDQSLHVMSIVIIAYMWVICSNNPLRESECVQAFFQVTNISEILVVKWLLGLLIIHKPANILIQNLIGPYKPKSNNANISTEENENVDANAGRMIGTIERLIIFILLYLGQYQAIGLVLTAKSIARYDQITSRKEFGEYYLLGTLTSVGITVVCAVLLF